MDTVASTRLTLLEKVSRRDQQSWNEFVPLYASLLKNYILRLATNYHLRLDDDEVEDVRQEVFIKLWRVLPGFRLDQRGRFRTWLWTVTRNVAIDWARRPTPAQPAEGFAEEEIEAATAEPQAELIAHHQREVLGHIMERAKQEVTDLMWACFDQHFLQKKPSKEVAAELGLSVSLVNTNTSRVLRRIREYAEYYDL